VGGTTKEQPTRQPEASSHQVEPSAGGTVQSGFGGELLRLQRVAGNRTVCALLAAQTKLEVGRDDDPLEVEADETATRIVAAGRGASGDPSEDTSAVGTSQGLVRSLRRRAASSIGPAGGEVDPALEKALSSARSGGSPLPTGVRRNMEGAFGADFSGVRLHEGAESAGLSQQLGAKAFTIGRDIFFRNGLPDASTTDGQHLMAHELTHTVQQGGSPVARHPERVQREGDDLLADDEIETLTRGGAALDAVGGQTSTFSGMGGIQGNVYQAGNNTTPGASGVAAGVDMSGLAAIGNVAVNSVLVNKAAKTKKNEARNKREGEATWKDADRAHSTAAVNVGSGVGTFSSSVLTGVGAGAQIASNAGVTSAFASLSNPLGAAGGAVALPVQVVATARTMRKAHKQRARAQALLGRINDPNADVATAKTALADHQEALQELIDSKASLEADLAERRDTRKPLHTAYLKLKDKAKSATSSKKHAAALATAWETFHAADLAVVEVLDELKDVDNDIAAETANGAKLDQAKKNAEQAIRDAADRVKNGTESPDDIRIYAFKKNDAGFGKKVASAVGGVLGILGGISGTVAAIAAVGATTVVAVTTLATPIGWALCGAAALVALALGGWAFWKWASKKWDRAGEEGLTGAQRFFAAISPWRKVGQSRRENNAERLYSYATGIDPDTQQAADATDQQTAREVIEDLGLDWGALKFDDATHQAAAVKLITEKMGS
jgi:hypothetical protein